MNNDAGASRGRQDRTRSCRITAMPSWMRIATAHREWNGILRADPESGVSADSNRDFSSIFGAGIH
jgi:hypothetical protein